MGTMRVESRLGDLSQAIARTMHDSFKREIKSRLQAIANNVVEEVAEALAKDIVTKVDHVIAQEPGGFGPEVRLFLRVNEKEKQYSVEKTVVEKMVNKT